MKKLLLLLLLYTPLLHAGFLAEQKCVKCHENIFKLSRIYTKTEWLKATSEHNATLRILHKNELEVLAYLDSPEYDPHALYRDLSFYAYETKAMQQLPVTCYQCHDNAVQMAQLWSDEAWMQLYNSVDPLVRAHTKYPKVAAYIKTPLFKEGIPEIVRRMQIFAKSQKKVREDRDVAQVLHYCKSCHPAHDFFSEHWTKQQWESLYVSLQPLKEAHQKYPKVRSYIDSDIFVKNKTKIISKLSFRAHESLKNEMRLKVGKMMLLYKKRYVTVNETQKILKLLRSAFEECSFKKPVHFMLQAVDSEGSATAIITVVSFGVIPTSETVTWELRARYGGKTYTAQTKEHHYRGLGSKESDKREETVQDLIELLRSKMKQICDYRH